MTLASSFAFMIAMFVLALTPGPGVFVSLSAGLSATRPQIIALIAGIISGDIIFLMLSIYGLAWVAMHLHGAFLLIQYGGAAFLCFIGIRILLDRNKTGSAEEMEQQTGHSNTGYLVGLLVTLSNPKVIFFYISFLPNFMDLTNLSLLDIGIVILIIALVLSISMGFYAWLAYTARKASLSETAQRRLNTGSGLLMVITGAILALKAQ